MLRKEMKMINLKNWSISKWLSWANNNNSQLCISCDFSEEDKEIKISGDNLFINYIKVEWCMDEIDIDNDTNSITILKGNYTIECKNVYAYFKGLGYIYVCWQDFVRTRTNEFEVWLGDKQ